MQMLILSLILIQLINYSSSQIYTYYQSEYLLCSQNTTSIQNMTNTDFQNYVLTGGNNSQGCKRYEIPLNNTSNQRICQSSVIRDLGHIIATQLCVSTDDVIKISGSLDAGIGARLTVKDKNGNKTIMKLQKDIWNAGNNAYNATYTAVATEVIQFTLFFSDPCCDGRTDFIVQYNNELPQPASVEFLADKCHERRLTPTQMTFTVADT